MRKLFNMIKQEHVGVPMFLFGHSLGSFLSRNFIMQYGNELDGVILSGTGGDPGHLGKVANLIADREVKKKGKRYRSVSESR